MGLIPNGVAARFGGLLRKVGWTDSRPARQDTRQRGATSEVSYGGFASRPDWSGRRRQAADGTYRADHGGVPPDRRWDPYAPNQSRASRARATRQRAKDRSGTLAVPAFYALLGVAPDAATEEIERAYRRRAAGIHPDRFYAQPGMRQEAEAKLRHLNEAVATLRDAERRARYDAEWRG